VSERDRPTRLPLAGGAWLRHRALPASPDRVLVTGPTGRFTLMPAAQLDAIVRAPTRDPRVAKLAALGLVHPRTPPEPRTADAFHHVVLVGTREAAMTEAVATSLVDALAASSSRFVRLDLVDEHPHPRATWPATRALVARARDRFRKLSKDLTISLTAPPHAVGAADRDMLLDARVALSIPCEGLPSENVASAVRDLHARYAARGVDPSRAFVTLSLAATRATLATSPRDLVAACVDLGLAFVALDLGAPDEHRAPSIEERLDLQRRFWDAILAANLDGTTIVEMRLALHLEALSAAATARDAPPPTSGEIVVHGPEGHALATDAALPDPSCAACVYDPYCGRGLVLHSLPRAAPGARALGTSTCRASMGTFDEVLARLGSKDGPALRQVFQRWMAVHREIAEHLSSSGDAR
jgi:hypothetical protein